MLAGAQLTPEFGVSPTTINSIPEINLRLINSLSKSSDMLMILKTFLKKVSAIIKELNLGMQKKKKSYIIKSHLQNSKLILINISFYHFISTDELWGGKYSNEILEIESSQEFYRFWSALCFIFHSGIFPS